MNDPLIDAIIAVRAKHPNHDFGEILYSILKGTITNVDGDTTEQDSNIAHTLDNLSDWSLTYYLNNLRVFDNL